MEYSNYSSIVCTFVSSHQHNSDTTYSQGIAQKLSPLSGTLRCESFSSFCRPTAKVIGSFHCSGCRLLAWHSHRWLMFFLQSHCSSIWKGVAQCPQRKAVTISVERVINRNPGSIPSSTCFYCTLSRTAPWLGSFSLLLWNEPSDEATKCCHDPIYSLCKSNIFWIDSH
jgi:hypothetical protein